MGDPNEHVNDPARLAALAATALLDSLPEEEFDRVTRLAAQVLGTPVSLVSLVDNDRQFFKSQFGLVEPFAAARQTPLSHSFCQTVVNTDKPLLVNDAANDERVAGNRAIDELGVIAYCGVPLRTPSGLVLGALCAIDGQPRDWQPAEVAALEDLAALVMTEVELRESLAREREVRQERESVTKSLQRALLPPANPRIPGVDLDTAYLPQSKGDGVGGDFFDVFDDGEGSWHVVVGDVCGKGPVAAQTALVVRSIVRSAAMRGESEVDILRSVDVVIIEASHPTVAVSYLVMKRDGDELCCRLTLAGQPHALIAGGDVLRPIGTYGSLLGAGVAAIELAPVEFTLSRGQFLALYTDGVTDQPHVEYDDDSLVDRLELKGELAATRLVDRIVELAQSATAVGAETIDDIAVVALGLKAN